MAKKKTKIVSNRGYATTSAPSKQIETPKKQEAPPKEVSTVKKEENTEPPAIPSTNDTAKKEDDPVLTLIEKYKTLHERKSQLALDRLTKEDTQTLSLHKEQVKQFCLTSDVENILLKVIKNKHSKLFGNAIRFLSF